MPRCAAFGCTNNSGTGKLMKSFPRDPHLRKLWQIKVRRKNWKPTSNSVLCEDHFDESQFEAIRSDGKRKLKANAVPTKFSFLPSTERRNITESRHPPCSSVFEMQENICNQDHAYSQYTNHVYSEDDVNTPQVDKTSEIFEAETVAVSAGIDVDYTKENTHPPNLFSCERCLQLEATNRKLTKSIKALTLQLNQLKKCLSRSISAKARLKKARCYPLKCSKTFLSDNQVEILNKNLKKAQNGYSK